MDKRTVRTFPLGEEPSDFEFWQKRPPEERLMALEQIRREYHDGDRQGFQRIYRIVKLAQK